MQRIAAPTSSTGRRLACSIVAVGMTACIAWLGSITAFAAHPDVLPVAAAGSLSAHLDVARAAEDFRPGTAGVLVPGGEIQHALTLTNDGTLDWATVALTANAVTSSRLDTDPAQGLQLRVDRCSEPWSEHEAAPGSGYRCSGTAASVLTPRPVSGAAMDLGRLASLEVGGSDALRITLTLPATAGNSHQGQTSIIDFSFIATQGSARHRIPA